METKTLFFYVSLAILVLGFSPIAIIDMIPGIIFTISGIYLVIFSLHIFVKNLKDIKYWLSIVSLSLTNKLVFMDRDPGRDAIKFLLLSLLITFSIDIILTKLSDRPLWDFFNEVPGLDPLSKVINVTEVATQLYNLTNQLFYPFQPQKFPVGFISSNLTSLNSNGDTDSQQRDQVPTTQQLRPFIGIATGAFTLFFLRQFIYRNRYIEKTEIPKNPGSRLLLLFLIASQIVFALDIIQDVSEAFGSFKNKRLADEINERTPPVERIIFDAFNITINKIDQEGQGNSIHTQNSGDTKKTSSQLYGVSGVIIFLSKLTNPFVYLTIISIWAFDWYLFSRIWVHYNR